MEVPAHSAITRRAAHLSFATERIEVFEDEVSLADGRTTSYLRLRTPGPGPGVVIAPVRGDELGLVLTYRYATSAWEWGFPRGGAHAKHPAVTAAVELREEMGLEATSWTVLGAITPDSGLLEDRCIAMIATISESGAGIQDTAEVYDTKWLTRKQLMSEIAAGQIEDGFTLATLMLLMAKE